MEFFDQHSELQAGTREMDEQDGVLWIHLPSCFLQLNLLVQIQIRIKTEKLIKYVKHSTKTGISKLRFLPIKQTNLFWFKTIQSVHQIYLNLNQIIYI